jgi:plastocyanin
MATTGRPTSLQLLAGALAVVVAAAPMWARARAAEPAPAPAPTAADLARVEAELARVQAQVREQRELILQLMQMHDSLLKYLEAGGAASGAAPPGLPAPAPARAGAPAEPAAAPSGAGSTTGTVTGHVHGATGDAYVYLDGARSIAAHAPTIEIRQEHRQFVPTIAVVPLGAHVLFPNHDTIFHNVFSSTPGDAFDLGTVKGGQTPQPITLLKPGHVEVFCNIHSRMRADVLVVPNGHWARVRADGSFALPGVPLGSRRIVLWGPSIKPSAQQIEVTPSGATATFSAEGQGATPHLNKTGGAYGSYEN